MSEFELNLMLDSEGANTLETEENLVNGKQYLGQAQILMNRARNQYVEIKINMLEKMKTKDISLYGEPSQMLQQAISKLKVELDELDRMLLTENQRCKELDKTRAEIRARRGTIILVLSLIAIILIPILIASFSN